MRMLSYALLSIMTFIMIFVSLGCAAVTNYPVITDSRGDYSGVIRTTHKAYIVPTSQSAEIWSDGSDEIFSMVYQNQYADRTIYTFNNFDPTASVIFLDQSFCDWRYEGCAVMVADDPHQDWLDDPFDYAGHWECSGARSVENLSSLTTREGECGDSIFSDFQSLAAEFADLPKSSFRGKDAYMLPINAANTSIVLTGKDGISTTMPLYGQFTVFLDSELRTIVPMTPNAKLQLGWLTNYAHDSGRLQKAEISYGSLRGEVDMALLPDNLAYGQSRF